MSQNEKDIVFGFTEKEVKILIMSLKCIETRVDRRSLNCERLAKLTGYSSADIYNYYMKNLLPKVVALTAVDLTGDGVELTTTDSATSAAASQVPTSGLDKKGSADSSSGQREEKGKEKVGERVYRGITHGVDGTGGDPDDEKE